MVVRESTLAGRTPRNLPQDITVVDLDVHIHESPGGLAPYCEMPWRKTLEHLSTLPYRYLDMPAFAPTAAIWPSFPETRGKRRSTAASPTELRRDLDDLGVDIAVMFPDHLLLHAALKQTSYAVALARAYNRWLEAEWLGQDAGLKGSIIAPHHDPVAAAAEVRRYASNVDVAAIYLPTSCVEPLYGHRRYDPLYEAAQETGLPVVMHSVAAVHPAFPFNLHGFETSFSAHILAHPFSLIANLVSMIETGVPVRFPGLKIAFTEAGIAWVPWIMLRMDKEYNEIRRDVPILKDRPSTYVRRMFFATQPIEEPERMRVMADFITLFGLEDSIIFASDWPHHDFDHPGKILQIPVSDEVRRKILAENALRLLRLPEPAP